MKLTRGFMVEVRVMCGHLGCRNKTLALGVPVVGIVPMGGPVALDNAAFLDEKWTTVGGGIPRCHEHSSEDPE